MEEDQARGIENKRDQLSQIEIKLRKKLTLITG